MKQMTVCLDRFFAGQKPLKAKWQARWYKNTAIFVLFHYHHVVLIYDTATQTILKQWWEVPADKRGLEAAKDYLATKKTTH